VRLQVYPEVFRPSERLAADVAFVWFYSGVDYAMSLEVGQSHEGFVADAAFEWTAVGAVVAGVLAQGGDGLEGLGTYSTAVIY